MSATVSQVRGWNPTALIDVASSLAAVNAEFDDLVSGVGGATRDGLSQWGGDVATVTSARSFADRLAATHLITAVDDEADEFGKAAGQLTEVRTSTLAAVDVAAAGEFAVADTGSVTAPICSTGGIFTDLLLQISFDEQARGHGARSVGQCSRRRPNEDLLVPIRAAAESELAAIEARHPDWARGQNVPPNEGLLDDDQQARHDDWLSWNDEREKASSAVTGFHEVRNQLDSGDRIPTFLMDIDDQGRGAIALDNPDTAHNVATCVPGTGPSCRRRAGTWHADDLLATADRIDRGSEKVRRRVWDRRVGCGRGRRGLLLLRRSGRFCRRCGGVCGSGADLPRPRRRGSGDAG